MRVVAKKINNPECDYLTEGKVYNVVKSGSFYFFITDSLGYVRHLKFKNCNHIDGNWTIIGNPAVAVKSEEV